MAVDDDPVYERAATRGLARTRSVSRRVRATARLPVRDHCRQSSAELAFCGTPSRLPRVEVGRPTARASVGARDEGAAP